MKIITNDAVYVQKNDIGFLNQTDLLIPVSVFLKVFGNGITIIDDSNRFEFIKFEDKEEIEFFQGLDFIVDYNLLKDLSEDEIMKLGQEVAFEKNNIAKKYNSLSGRDRANNMYMVSECEKLDFKMYSIRDILWYKQGYIKFDMPIDLNVQKEEKGFKKLLRKIKKK